MDRLFVISLTFYFLTACTSIPISEPLKQTKADNTLVQWQASEPVTRCEASTITDFRFVLHHNGEWQSTAKLKNTDLHKYRPYWNDHITLKFLNGTEPAVTLDLFTEKMRAASIRTVEKSGVWKVGYEHFNKLQSATVTVVHDCEGLLEG
ncbi:hypothetical protein [Pseudomaricurvus alkylphenolicus]|uniref:hypothetical protein n=1 Tax=Pseudomaricurvus alkylphenolicus TaxID=1306991 RepID=UPI001422B491|nr:hypothetical protein [Pseudomaricurvus alkylphenolicus]